jgi:hypothetical protein
MEYDTGIVVAFGVGPQGFGPSRMAVAPCIRKAHPCQLALPYGVEPSSSPTATHP